MGELIEAKYGSEAGHWYKRDGTPAYEIVGKNGNRRPTTLRDAKALDLLPSVTTIIKCAAQPGLEKWKQEQLLLSAMTLPEVVWYAESEEDWLKRVYQDSQEQARKAAERGTEIHAALEAWFAREPFDPELAEICGRVAGTIDAHFGDIHWLTEKTFASRDFGGKMDAISDDGSIIWDAKTKDFTEDTGNLAYDENLIQLAAYRVGSGHPDARCANLYVTRNEPWLVRVHEWSEEELRRGWRMFEGLLQYWRAKSKWQDTVE